MIQTFSALVVAGVILLAGPSVATAGSATPICGVLVYGQSAATAGAMAIDDKVAVQKVDYTRLRKQLEADGQVLELEQ